MTLDPCGSPSAASPTSTSGCAGTLTRYIVDTRNHQGDLAYEARNLADAAVAYRLALRLAPQDEHARAGLAAVQLRLADELIRNRTSTGRWRRWP